MTVMKKHFANQKISNIFVENNVCELCKKD